MSGQLQNGEQQFFDNNGKPLNGGTIDFYVPNTTTRKTTWQDQALTIQNTNPIILDAGGKAIIWGSGSYRQILKDAHGNLIWDKVVADPIVSLSAPTGASQVGADDGAGGTLFTTVAGFITKIFSNAGSSLVGFIQSGAGAITRTLQGKNRDSIHAADFGVLMDGTDETAKLQNALNFVQSPGAPKKLVIGWGQTGSTLITAGLFINSGGITIEFENSNITLKKRYNGSVFVVLSGLVKFVNPGIDGGADLGYTGSAIRYADASLFTYDGCIDSPRIRNTQDSCIIFNGPRGGAGTEIRGGSLIPYNPTGVSSAGPAAIRLSGPADNDATPRKITDVDSSSSPLIDLTGMQTTFIKGGQCATILFDGNPDVTGATFYSSKAAVTGVRIRDGLNIAGQDHTFSANSSGGYAPGQSTWSWIFKSNAANCRADASNVTLNKITDLAGSQGDNCNRFFSDNVPYNLLWTAAGTQPSIGDGIITATYSVSSRLVDVSLYMQFGSATTFGTGEWEFSLPYQAISGQGTARLFKGGGPIQMGIDVLSSGGNPSKFKITPASTTDGVAVGDSVPFTWTAGAGFMQIQFTFMRS